MIQTELKKIPKYRRIETDLLGLIRGGNIHVGQQVPTEVAISEEYDVSRLTVRKALENLENKGYLDRTPGKGTFVTDWKKSQESSSGGSSVLMSNNNIGLLMLDDDLSIANPEGWDMRLLRQMTYEAERFSYHVTVCCPTGQQIASKEMPTALREKTICGAVVDGRLNDLVISRLIEPGVPILLAGTHLNRLNVPEIRHDTEDMGYKLTKSLLELNNGPVWLVGPLTFHYLPNLELYKGYQRAVFDFNSPDRLSLMNLCAPQQCENIIRQMAHSNHQRHCVIALSAKHLKAMLEYIKLMNLDPEHFVFISVGRYDKELSAEPNVVLCEIEPTKIAKEAVSQMISLSEHGTALKTRIFKLKIELSGNSRKPFIIDWE